ncbi:uncharacterized protein PRCAT00006177001 [Priceomyces carsonii]|uniref:uncharacterized protein n=1 Tax=Priceomyces carsonii TaxID=28549 RepID=UPI002ED92948|nr:unnamed protein product [Priceomyces carsonii]
MNREDEDLINKKFLGCALYSYSEPDPNERKQIVDAIDYKAINRDLVSGVFNLMGSSAEEFHFAIDEYDHLHVYNPRLTDGNIDDDEEYERVVKRKLHLYGAEVFNWTDKDDYEEIINDKTYRHVEKEANQTGAGHKVYGPLPLLLNYTDDICSCWVPRCVERALHRSGNYIKPDKQRFPDIDLELWRYHVG